MSDKKDFEQLEYPRAMLGNPYDINSSVLRALNNARYYTDEGRAEYLKDVFSKENFDVHLAEFYSQYQSVLDKSIRIINKSTNISSGKLGYFSKGFESELANADYTLEMLSYFLKAYGPILDYIRFSCIEKPANKKETLEEQLLLELQHNAETSNNPYFDIKFTIHAQIMEKMPKVPSLRRFVSENSTDLAFVLTDEENREQLIRQLTIIRTCHATITKSKGELEIREQEIKSKTHNNRRLSNLFTKIDEISIGLNNKIQQSYLTRFLPAMIQLKEKFKYLGKRFDNQGISNAAKYQLRFEGIDDKKLES